jgi:drug/metabolite transporter (DMT)-like permease
MTFLDFVSNRERLTLPDWKTGGLIVLLGFSGMYGSQLTMGFGQSLAPASYSCLIGITVPIFVFIISVASGLEKVKWTRWSGLAKVAGVLSAVCGGILIPLYNGPVVISRLVHAIPLPELPLDVRGVLASSFSSLNVGDDAIGGFLLVLCGFLQALYWTFQAEIIKRYPAPIAIAAMARIASLSLMTVTGLVLVEPSAWAIPRISDIVAIVYGGIVPYGLFFGLQCWAGHEGGPVLLAVYKPLQSFTTIGMAYFVLSENIYLGSILGLLCIVHGLLWLTWGQITSRKEDENAVKLLPSTVVDGAPIMQEDSDLKRPLLG